MTDPRIDWAGQSLEVMQVPVISTAHLDQETARRLTEEGNNNLWCTCVEWEHGFFLYIDDLGDDAPQCLRDIKTWLNECGFTDCWVRLDSDAQYADGLTSYSW